MRMMEQNSWRERFGGIAVTLDDDGVLFLSRTNR